MTVGEVFAGTPAGRLRGRSVGIVTNRSVRGDGHGATREQWRVGWLRVWPNPRFRQEGRLSGGANGKPGSPRPYDRFWVVQVRFPLSWFPSHALQTWNARQALQVELRLFVETVETVIRVHR